MISKGLIDLSAVDVIKKMVENEESEEVKSRSSMILRQIKKSAALEQEKVEEKKTTPFPL